MNRVERLVTSLEVSRKLKDLGIVRDSCFYWVAPGFHQEKELWIKSHNRYYSLSDGGGIPLYKPENIVSAFTVTELMAMYELTDDDGFPRGKKMKYNRAKLSSFIPDEEAALLMRSIEDEANKINIDQCNQNLTEWINK